MAGSKFLCTGSGGLQLYLAKDGSVRFDSQPGQVNWYKLHFIINSCKSLLRRPSIRLLLPFLVFIFFSYHSFFHFSAIWWLQGGGDWKEIVTPLSNKEPTHSPSISLFCLGVKHSPSKYCKLNQIWMYSNEICMRNVSACDIKATDSRKEYAPSKPRRFSILISNSVSCGKLSFTFLPIQSHAYQKIIMGIHIVYYTKHIQKCEQE